MYVKSASLARLSFKDRNVEIDHLVSQRYFLSGGGIRSQRSMSWHQFPKTHWPKNGTFNAQASNVLDLFPWWFSSWWVNIPAPRAIFDPRLGPSVLPTAGMHTRSSGVTVTSSRTRWSWLSPAVCCWKSWLTRERGHWVIIIIIIVIGAGNNRSHSRWSKQCNTDLLHGFYQVQVVHHETIHACLNLQQFQSNR